MVGARKYSRKPIFSGPQEPASASRHFDSEAEQGTGKYLVFWVPNGQGSYILKAYSESFPNAENSVSPGSGKTRFGTQVARIHYQRSAEDHETSRKIRRQLEPLRERLGLQPHDGGYLNAHCMCTTRMSSSPDDGVVDPDLCIHGVENVFVCGMGCFSTGGAANPTVTVAALAHRLVETIVKRL